MKKNIIITVLLCLYLTTPSNCQTNNTITFNSFELLVKNEDYIPISMIKRYVSSEPKFYKNDFRFIGKFVNHKKNYKVFLIKCGNKTMSNNILITFNHKNKKIDTKCFPSLRIKDNVKYHSDIFFDDDMLNFEFCHYKPIIGDEMPDLDSLDTSKTQKWLIRNGVILKKK